MLTFEEAQAKALERAGAEEDEPEKLVLMLLYGFSSFVSISYSTNSFLLVLGGRS